MQEFMVMPFGAPNFAEGLRWGAEIYHALKSVLKEDGFITLVGDEGGYAPSLKANSQAIEVILAPSKKSRFQGRSRRGRGHRARPGRIRMYEEETKDLQPAQGRQKADRRADGRILAGWVRDYPIVSIEDAWRRTTGNHGSCWLKTIGDKCQLVGDDLLVTNRSVCVGAIKENAANAAAG